MQKTIISFLALFTYFTEASASTQSIVNDILNEPSRNSPIEYSSAKSFYKLTKRLDSVCKQFSLGHQRRLSYHEALQALNGVVQKASGGHAIYSGGSHNDAINCGHIVPQSFFHNVYVMKSDLHHLYLAYQSINFSREKYKFAMVPDKEANIIYNGSIKGVEDSDIVKNISKFSKYGCKISEKSKKFEPDDDAKGKIARACAYFFTRYPWLLQKMSDVIEISTMVEWHEKFPPGDSEKKREAEIFKIQKNHNPYITQSNCYMREVWLPKVTI